MTAHPHSGSDKGRRTNPCPLLHVDCLDDQIESRRFVIMIPSAEKSPLRKADMAGNHDGDQIQQPAFLADPDMVADFEPPGKMNIHAGADDHAAPDFGAKQTQPESANRRGQGKRRGEKQAAHQHPKRLFKA